MYVVNNYQGTCLPNEYIDGDIDYIFVCKRGHIFSRSISDIFNGNWCDECTIEMDKLEYFKSIAIDRNCILLSTVFTNKTDKGMEWCCHDGHYWTDSISNVLRRRNPCLECEKIHRYDDMKNELTSILDSKGYRYKDKYQLDKIVRYRTTIKIVCDMDHITSACTDTILESDDFICSKCRKRSKYTIEDARNIAKQRGGECLSDEYKNGREKLLWKCHYGHTWETGLSRIISEYSWCSKCNISIGEEISRMIFVTLFGLKFPKSKYDWLDGLELDGYNESMKLAFEYNGEQHYKLSTKFHETIEEFKAQQARDFKKNKLCGKLGIRLITIPYTIKFTKLQTFIMEKCIELKIDIPFRKHIDITKFNDIYKLNRKLLDEFIELVEKKGGTVVDDNQVYIDYTHKLEVECKKKHRWKTSLCNMRRNVWCGKCANDAMLKYTIEDMMEVAIKNDWVCLSDAYMGINGCLSWKCNKCEYEWEMLPKTAANRSLCPECYRRSQFKYDINDMRKLANNNNGECLSDEFLGVERKLLWKCNECEHEWNSMPQTILNGSWCPNYKKHRTEH